VTPRSSIYGRLLLRTGVIPSAFSAAVIGSVMKIVADHKPTAEDGV
jgi:hypothetical protein